MSRITSALAATVLAFPVSLAVIAQPQSDESVKQAPTAELWIDPGRAPRDLFWGVGGKTYAPPADALYELKAKDDAGFSTSYDVTSPDGVEWSAKIGPEAQTEVVVSRILWGLGYHQPPVYYLPSWKLNRGEGEPRVESEARFRPKIADLQRQDGFWKWKRNPFSGTRELNGLLVILLTLNSTDLKDDNNSIYTTKKPWDGAARWFVVRDIGASLGETGKLFPRRNWLEGFERQAFLKSVTGDRVEFDYDGRHRELLTMISPDDVRWAARLMNRLTDAQWRDAFRAGNYAEADANRFIARIKQKINDGIALRVDASAAKDAKEEK